MSAPNKNGNVSTFFGPIEPQKFDFSYKPMKMPTLGEKGVFYRIFVVGGDKFWILKFVYLE